MDLGSTKAPPPFDVWQQRGTCWHSGADNSSVAFHACDAILTYDIDEDAPDARPLIWELTFYGGPGNSADLLNYRAAPTELWLAYITFKLTGELPTNHDDTD